MEERSKRTEVVFAREAIEKMKKGLDIAANAITCTMGPKGKCVVIQKDDELPIVTKDGVTVSKSISLKHPLERIGANLLKQAASMSNDVAGDGTTTASALTYALTTFGLQSLFSGRDAVSLRNGMEFGVNEIVKVLSEKSQKVTSKNEIIQVGIISSNNDSIIGNIIADAMEIVGNDGIITTEDSTGTTTYLETTEGMKVERGYISPMFVTNNEKMNVVFEDCYVLITDKKITSLKEIIAALEISTKANKPIFIIAEDIEGDAMNGLILNKVKGVIKVAAIRAPGNGFSKQEILQDLCILTGAELISSKTGINLEECTSKHLGKLKKLTIDAKSTVMVSDGKTKEKVEQRCEQLRSLLEENSFNEDERKILKLRLAKLSSGIAVIRVGGITEVEMKERKYRIEDALAATKSAVEEGILPGGGISLYRAKNHLKELIKQQEFEKDFRNGIECVIDACDMPLKKICRNAGISFEVIDEKLKDKEFSIGCNALTNEIVDMYEKGIIDPTKVTRCALENAFSVANMFLSLDAVVYDEE
jgi:chaperonin GroEL